MTATAEVTAAADHAREADPVLAASSIAVLPFADMSPEKDQEYFSDGISEELLNVLAQLPELRVVGRTSSFTFKGQNKDLREIGEILNVTYIVEGSIRKAGNKVRITAQLIKADDAYHLWSNTYDRDLTDIFAVEDEIARSTVREMSTALPALAHASTAMKLVAHADIDADDAFLLAREKMTQGGSVAAYNEAVGLLDYALANDPHYAPALAWRSYAAAMLSDAPGSIGDTPVALNARSLKTRHRPRRSSHSAPTTQNFPWPKAGGISTRRSKRCAGLSRCARTSHRHRTTSLFPRPRRRQGGRVQNHRERGGDRPGPE